MTILSALYQLFIGPLELFFEVVFTIANRVIGNPGLSIIVLSLAMNFLVLPLYRQADAMQEAERDRSQAMKPWVDHIKKTFKGDERFMMLQTYYRQCNYKQTDALKGSISLLLEIPFFIAAYHFLSNLEILRGVPFGPIADLGAPDGLIVIGGLTINALPILMTLINIIAAAIYMKGFPLQSKIQMYGIAAIFLILLYGSPAGLVFYWTLNNMFSLAKNVFYKLKNPALVLSVLASIVGIVGLVFVVFVHPLGTLMRQGVVIAFCLLLQFPLALRYYRRKRPKQEKPVREVTREESRVFLYCCIFLALLTGLLIPTAVIASSPLEFTNLLDYKSPLWYVVNALLIAVGTFIIWFGIFYRLATPSGKRTLSAVMWVIAGVGVVNYMFFGTNYGTLTSFLSYDNALIVQRIDMLKNLAIAGVVAGLLLFAWYKKNIIVRVISLSMCAAIVGMSLMNIVGIQQTVEASSSIIASANQGEATIPLSKNGKNVIILMFDRAASQCLPYAFHEKPELKEAFKGFVYYPNTMSFGSNTNVGLPGIFGGYEYVPEKMNERDDIKLSEKTDESLKVMPVLFGENGYDVTVCDPTYAGYEVIPDLSIYDDYPAIRKFITMNGSHTVDGLEFASSSNQAEVARMRNFFCYGIFRIAPVVLQPTLYDYGMYNSEDILYQRREDVSHGLGLDSNFMQPYAVLCDLTDITEITDSENNTFLMMCNDTTHEPTLLEEPGYKPSLQVDNAEYDATHEKRYDDEGSFIELSNLTQMCHYHINMAALLKMGEWFDYLRENGVYDNTRIVIVSDHSWPLGFDENMLFNIDSGSELAPSVDVFNCVLLYKDFSSESFQVDERFMTNADTPALAMAGLIDNPINPFTGRAINGPSDRGVAMHAQLPVEWRTGINNGNTFLPGHWFSVHDDVRDADNWEYLGLY